MLKEEPKQGKFVYGPSIYENVIEEDHFLKKLDESIDWNRVDTISRPLYCEDNGKPVINFPRRIFKAEILQFKYNWSDRETEEQVRYNIAINLWVRVPEMSTKTGVKCSKSGGFSTASIGFRNAKS